MTRKQIEQMRETRLWFKDIVIPLIATGATVLTFIPEARTACINKINIIKYKLKKK